jgi:N-acetylglucosamine kinase-like BadF-type ATPase
LTEPLLSALNLTDVQDLLHTIHAEHTTRTDIAALAPIVLDAADNDDTIATELIHYGAEELARMVQAVAQNLGWIDENVQAVIIGGLGENPDYAAEVASIVGKRAPNVQFVEPKLSPVMGAGLLALESEGVRTQDLGHRT